MKQYTPFVIFIGLVLLLIAFKAGVFESSSPSKEDAAVEEASKSKFKEPSEMLRQLVERPVRQAVSTHESPVGLAWFYARVAESMKSSEVVTTEQARLIHKKAGDSLAKTSSKITYCPELAKVCEDLFREYIGKENRTITSDDRDRFQGFSLLSRGPSIKSQTAR